ncbi:hypothetical protein O181_119465 [Austropuccinia psidii MF-1]|uniref:Uncharacterized protein n=1 Tax=Austropuccinia psidii MF-1 TaxID=1389203 RepID=A0A9Q3KE41_9BASI|nr:hypothetical protein [Austropuccinia psidii MF-1]
MVHTRNGTKYSIQPDGCGQGRGKTRARKSSLRKTCLEDSTVAPHSPRSIPTNLDVNSEPELIEGNILRAEPFPSGRNRNISVPIQKLVQRSKRREIFPSLWQGAMNSYLHIKNFLGQENTIELLGGWRPLSCKEKVKKMKNWSKNKSLLSIDQKKEQEMTPALKKEGPVASTSSRSVQRQSQRTSEEAERSQEPSRRGKRQSQLACTLPTGVHDPQIGAFNSEKCVQYGQDAYGVLSQVAGKDEQDFSMQIRKKIHFVRASINVDLGRIDAKLTKITLDINDMKKNNKHPVELHKSAIAKLESISNTCDQIDSKSQVQDDEMEYLSTTNINDQFKILKNHVLTVVDNTNQFAIHLQGVTVKGRN